MPKAEVGSTKHVANKMKSKGLQRLRWYCQVCEKQCRDENGFKMHSQSESHVRKMLIVGEDPRKAINEFSDQFLRDFLQLLKTGHGEKSIHINRFYQEYIANKEHVHMNATKWPNLTELAKYLGRESICRVEENDKGLHISWIDNSPEALKRQEALRRKEAQDRGNEEAEQTIIQEQIKRAQKAAEARGEGKGAGGGDEEPEDEAQRQLNRVEGEKIKLSFGGAKPAASSGSATAAKSSESPAKGTDEEKEQEKEKAEQKEGDDAPKAAEQGKPSFGGGLSLKMTAKPQTKNVFAQAKKNALSGGAPKKNAFEQPKKMSEAERIMKEDMERQERKRARGGSGAGAPSWKKQKTDR